MHRLGNANVRRDLFVLVSPLARTARHTAMCGGLGESACGSPIKRHLRQVLLYLGAFLLFWRKPVEMIRVVSWG